MKQKLHNIKFGTDGWRGVISDSFTFDNVRRVAVAIADYYNQQVDRRARIVVGYDTRFLSQTYARVISEGLAAKGIRVILSDKAIPTPALSFATKSKNMTAGVMITASHNPAIYNGVKIKTNSGGAASPEITTQIEKRLPKYSLRLPVNSKLIIKSDLTADYIKFLRSYINLRLLRKVNFRVLVDAMYGSGNGFIADVLKGTSIRLDFMRNQVNPTFDGLRPEPVLENLSPTLAKLKSQRYDLGLVLDGDADRIGAFAGRGEFVNAQKILGLLTLHLVCNRKMSGAVVKTIAGTTLIDKIAAYLGLKLYETPVGFKYISELMEEADVLIGGEEAGGIGFKGYIPERDGSLAGILLLEMMAYQKKPLLKILNEMEQKFGRYYYLRDDIYLRELKSARALSSKLNRLKSKRALLEKRVIQVKDFDGVKLTFSDESWLMLRVSGTEPLVRVYAEAKNLTRSKQLINFGRNFVGK
ncbi:MAG: phosphoglucomutase/phosphomannomutase family protein [Candidatus Omnitrophota bacterium]|jgi:phosphomannomutase